VHHAIKALATFAYFTYNNM